MDKRREVFAYIAAVLSGVVVAVMVWGTPVVPMYDGAASLASIFVPLIVVLGAVTTFVFFNSAPSIERAMPSWVMWLGRLTSAVAIGLALFVFSSVFFFALDNAFTGGVVQNWMTIIVAVASGWLITTLVIGQVRDFPPPELAGVAVTVLFSGIIVSMLLVSDPAWWRESVSYLGGDARTDNIFNLSVLTTGLVVFNISVQLAVTLNAAARAGIVQVAAWKLRVLVIALVIISMGIAGVGLFPWGYAPGFALMHDVSSHTMLLVFIVLMFFVNRLLPIYEPPFVRTSRLFGVGSLLVLAGYITQQMVFSVAEFLWFILLGSWTLFFVNHTWNYLKAQTMPQQAETAPRRISLVPVIATGVVAVTLVISAIVVVGSALRPPQVNLQAAGWEIIPGAEGTTCASGTPYQFYSRSDVNADQLLIYFQTGGACWSAQNCSPGSLTYDATVDDQELATYGGIFDFTNRANPLIEYDIVFIPYCTGDVHMGDAVVEYQGTLDRNVTINHKGAVNVRSVLDWVYGEYESPRRIVVAGSSAGGIASALYAPEIMTHYASSQVVQFNDGYVGIAPDDWEAFDQWNIWDNLPADLPDTLRSSDTFSFAAAYEAIIAAHPEREFGLFSHAADAFQMGYLVLAGGDMTTWAGARDESLEQWQALPNFASYLGNGVAHTVLATGEFYSMAVGGQTFRDWFSALVAGRPVENVTCTRGSISCP